MMRLSDILYSRFLVEGSVSDILNQTMPIRIRALEYPAELLGITPDNLLKLLDFAILRQDLSEYTKDSFWDRLAKLCGTSMDTTGLFRKCFDRAKSLKYSKLRYLQGYKDSYDKACSSLDFGADPDRLKDILDTIAKNLFFFDAFLYLLDSYVPGIDR